MVASDSLQQNADSQAVQLMWQMLNLASQQAFQQLSSLQTLVWFAYHVMEKEPRSPEPYLVLAFVFALLREPNRSYQILLYADRLFPSRARIQYMLNQLRLDLEKAQPEEELTPEAESRAGVGSVSFADLPAFHELNSLLQGLDPLQMQRDFQALRPSLAGLAKQFIERGDKHEF